MQPEKEEDMTTETKTTHTPGPLELGSDGALLTDDGGTVVALVKGSLTTAARLKACYNACEGLDPSYIGDVVMALEDTLRYLVTPAGFPEKGKGRTAEQQDAYDAARAALAALKGEQ